MTPRSPDLAIFMLTNTHTQTDKPIALPLAHARRVIVIVELEHIPHVQHLHRSSISETLQAAMYVIAVEAQCLLTTITHHAGLCSYAHRTHAGSSRGQYVSILMQ